MSRRRGLRGDNPGIKTVPSDLRWREQMDQSYNDMIGEVELAFQDQFGYGEMSENHWGPFVVDVYDTHVIVEEDARYYKVARDGDKFAERGNWQPATPRRIWVLKAAERFETAVNVAPALKALMWSRLGTLLAYEALLTPRDWWTGLNTEFNFTLDAAASKDNALCDRYLTEEDDALEREWTGSVWCSPPWHESSLPRWVAKARDSVASGAASVVVMLLPERPKSSWYRDLGTAEVRRVSLKFTRETSGEGAVNVEPHILAVFRPTARKVDSAIAFDVDSACPRKAVKVLDSDTRRIGMYATVWGELDCDGERMTVEGVKKYVDGVHTPYMWWKHGVDPHFGTNEVGLWDPVSFKVDDVGLYVEGNLHFDEWGDEAWRRLESSGQIGASVGTIWYLVKRERLSDGSVALKDWPLLDISIMEGGKQCVPSASREFTEATLKGMWRTVSARKHNRLQLRARALLELT